MILNDAYTLSNKVCVPKLALGTWFIDDEAVVNASLEAFKLGYRHIDTAQAYENERGVGEAVRLSGLAREEIFITTKLAAEAKTYEQAKALIDQSLKVTGLDYLDLMIIHSPRPWMEYHESEPYFEGNRQAWRALEEAYQAGKLKAIGVSNFEQEDIENIIENCTIKPMVNQVLAHIGNTPFDLIDYCNHQDILVEAYSPIAHGQLLKSPIIGAIAKKHNVSVAQLAIGYLLQLGLLPIPKTANPAHMQTNATIDFEISNEDMLTLVEIGKIDDYGDMNIMPVFGGRLR